MGTPWIEDNGDEESAGREIWVAREGLKQQRQHGNEDTIEGLKEQVKSYEMYCSNIHWVVEEDVEPCRNGSIHRLLVF